MEECTDVNQCISILLNNEAIVKMSRQPMATL